MSNQCKSVLSIRSKVLNLAREWLRNNDFVEVQGPIIIPEVGGGPCSIKVDYFGKNAYLSGGLQPYADRFLEMFDKVFTVSPTFRAEGRQTKRHLAEYWRIEVQTTSNFEKILHYQEKMLSYIVNQLVKVAAEDLITVGRNLNQISVPFERLTYDEAIGRLQKLDFQVFWGQKLSWELEQKLSLMFNNPFFITSFPVNSETFLFEPIPESCLTLSADLLAPGGYGEIASSGQVLTDKKSVVRALKETEIEGKALEWYLEHRNFGSNPQSGFSLGVERLLMWLCNLNSISDATAFPRDSSHPL